MDNNKTDLKCYNPASEKCKKCILMPINNCEQDVLIINSKETNFSDSKPLGVDTTAKNGKIDSFINNFKSFINNFKNSKILVNQHGESGLILQDKQVTQEQQVNLELKNLKKQEDAVYPDLKIERGGYPVILLAEELDNRRNLCYNISERRIK